MATQPPRRRPAFGDSGDQQHRLPAGVCLDDGWSIRKYRPDGSWGNSGGFDLTLAYHGAPAVRHRQVSGGLRTTIY